MQHWGMTTAGLQMDSAHPTGEVRVSLQAGQPSFDILPERAYDHIWADAMPAMDPSLFYHGSLALRLPESAAALDQLLRRHAAPVFMDVNLRPPWWDRDQLGRLLDRARWVKINDHELETLVTESGDLQSKAKILMQRHELSWAIVTQGAQGAFARDSNGAVQRISPTPATKVVDTVGAGDAFASVCILGLLQDWPLDLILQRAQRFASLLVGQRGATINDLATYQSIVDEWQTTE